MPDGGLIFNTRLHERRLVLSFPDLPPAGDGLRLCFISDLHVRRRHPLYDQLIGYLRGRTFDVACCGGDVQYGTDVAPEVPLKVARSVFAAVRPRLGWFLVRGNNDQRSFVRRLEGEGVRLLRNQSVLLAGAGENGRNGDCPHFAAVKGTVPISSIFLAGVDDPHYGYDDLDTALDGVGEGAFTILLAHSPDVIHEARRRKVRLVLSGHTHGGQIRVPVAGALYTQTRVGREFAYGLSRKGVTTIFTTSGVGYALLPVRVNCPAEVVDITLRRGSEPHVDSGPVPIGPA